MPLDSAATIFPLLPSIAMRGLGVGDTATRSLVLVDGLPINGGFFGNVFWNRAPKQNIERVEVVRGSSSSLFGSFAMGGVVNARRCTTANPPRKSQPTCASCFNSISFQGIIMKTKITGLLFSFLFYQPSRKSL